MGGKNFCLYFFAMKIFFCYSISLDETCQHIPCRAMQDFDLIDEDFDSIDELRVQDINVLAWATYQAIRTEITHLESIWLLPNPMREDRNVLTLLEDIYKWGLPGYAPAGASLIFEEASQSLTQMHGYMKECNDADLLERITVLCRAVHGSYSTLCAIHEWAQSESSPELTTEDMLLRFQAIPAEKDKDIHIVIQYILQWTKRWNLRHHEHLVYQQILIEGRPINAWVPAENLHGVEDVHTLDKLCAFICRKSRSEAMWKKFLSVHHSAVYDTLKTCIEPEFPVLKTTRAWIAFKDGLYSIYHDVFVYHNDARIELPKDLTVCAYHNIKFASAYLPVARVAGAAIPQCLPIHNPLRDLPTPSFDMILDTQQLCGHTKFWLMAMMGRCLFPAGMLDNWQVALYIKGRAGTGKSTLIDLLSSIYNEKDIATIPNDAESTWGLMSLPNKLMWVAPEVKVDFKMDQIQFQALASNDKMCIHRKHSRPWEGHIMCHGAMAGNTLPSRWLDNAGSIRRRLFVINFSKTVKSTKNNLLTTMQKVELPAIIRKIVWCYRTAAVLVGDRDIWSSGCLSQHIEDENEKLYAATNPLRKFLYEKIVDIRLGYWCPLTEFAATLRVYNQRNNLIQSPWSEDYYSAVFADVGLRVREAEYIWGNDASRRGLVVDGCCPEDMKCKMVVHYDGPNPVYKEDDEQDRADGFRVTQAEFDSDSN
jgi:hypothetical protein